MSYIPFSGFRHPIFTLHCWFQNKCQLCSELICFLSFFITTWVIAIFFSSKNFLWSIHHCYHFWMYISPTCSMQYLFNKCYISFSEEDFVVKREKDMQIVAMKPFTQRSSLYCNLLVTVCKILHISESNSSVHSMWELNILTLTLILNLNISYYVENQHIPVLNNFFCMKIIFFKIMFRHHGKIHPLADSRIGQVAIIIKYHLCSDYQLQKV